MNFGQFEIIIGTAGTGAEFQAPIGVAQQFLKPRAANEKIKCVWYHPVDNITNLTHFDLIQVGPAAADSNSISFNLKANKPAIIRLAVTYLFTA